MPDQEQDEKAFGLRLVLPYFDRGAFLREPAGLRPSAWLVDALDSVKGAEDLTDAARKLVEELRVDREDLALFQKLRGDQESFNVMLRAKTTAVLCTPELVGRLLEQSPDPYGPAKYRHAAWRNSSLRRWRRRTQAVHSNAAATSIPRSYSFASGHTRLRTRS